jgi:hypothetical protein
VSVSGRAPIRSGQAGICDRIGAWMKGDAAPFYRQVTQLDQPKRGRIVVVGQLVSRESSLSRFRLTRMSINHLSLHPTYQCLAPWSDDKFRVADNPGSIGSHIARCPRSFLASRRLLAGEVLCIVTASNTLPASHLWVGTQRASTVDRIVR